MDKINTSVASLKTADTTLKELKNSICAIISGCESSIKDQFNGIDLDFQKTLLEHIEYLKSFKTKVIQFETENDKALQERAIRISEYSATAYKRRNIL